MQREVTRLTTLVNNVLRFSDSDRNGKPNPIHRRPTEIASFLHDVVDGFKPLASARSMAIEEDWSSPMIAWVDPDALRQVILNILDNAVKYGPDGQTMRVSASSDGDAVRLVITDEGGGIPEVDRVRVWNAFERGSPIKDSATAGSGIGLSVVRDIIDAHGGKVSLDENFGHGARFVIELPLVPPTKELNYGQAALSIPGDQ
jgi:signal transduction histidine kinase